MTLKKRWAIVAGAAVLGLVALGTYVSGIPLFPTTEKMAEQAIEDCGLSPDDLLWRVQDGTLYVGSKEPPGTGPQSVDMRCLIDWAFEKRVRLGFIGWEQLK